MNTRHLTVAALAGLRWRAYIRESTERQAEAWSPERQRVDIQRAAAELGLVAVEAPFYERTGTGEAVSDELDQALADGRAGQYDVLLVLTTSRFARNRAEAVRRKAEFAAAGIPIYFVQDRIVSGARSSRLLEGVREVIDEEENEQRRFFIAGGLRERQRSGRWAGAIPFGYRRALVDFPDGSRGWDGALEPDPDEAPVVRDIFQTYVAGATARTIARDLNAAGTRRWTSGTIQKMLGNVAYTGRMIRYRSVRGAHYYERTDDQDGYADLGERFPALIPDEMFARVGEQLARRTHGSGDRRLNYPLSGILRCAECGYQMGGAHNKNRRYYRCRGRAEYGTCSAPFVRADEVEERFAAWLASYSLPADWRAEIARSATRGVKNDEADRQKRLSERLARLRKLYLWNEIPEDEYRRDTAAIKNEMGVMTMPSTASLVDIAAALERLGPAWGAAPAEMRAALPPMLLTAGEVSATGVEWVIRPELRPILDMCDVRESASLYSEQPGYTTRYSA